jgi:predicted Zn-dependent peptidase
MPVKAGSTYDPQDNTGLAHYLEHMMFKGSPKFGTIDWESEKLLLQQISDLYEKHKAETDPAKKKEIYKEIDRTSQEAAKYAAANEYDKLISSIGGKGTNAYTTNERTVFINNIPSNEIEKWLELESERMFNLVLRLFHTELETVYEEFNMGQDRDGTKAYFALMSALFPNHPYGQQTTIGKAEHLKNPSMENIRKYWSTYYVPNNMAICLSGDFDYEKTIQLIDKYFGPIEPKEVPEKVLPTEEPITKIKDIEVFGPQAEFVMFAYRFNGVNSEDQKYVTLIDYLLNNSQAGLIDIDLNQQQKVLNAGSGPSFMKEYGFQTFRGTPRQGQTLEEVRDLLLAEIEKIKTGNFDDWLIEACINDMKLNEIRSQESNFRAHKFATAFANGISWENTLKFNDDLANLTKKQIVKFASEKFLDNNYVIVYKRKGEDTLVVKVDKPEITPVDLKRENESEFYKKYTTEESERLSPVFIDFKQAITQKEFAPGVNFSYIANPTNKLFKLMYIVDKGKDHDKNLALAVGYLPYLGTDKYNAAELKQEFFKYGLDFGVSTNDDRSYVYISGLEENASKAVELLEHILANVVPDKEAYDKYIDGIQKKRADQKLDKSEILYGALFNYAVYGAESSYRDILLQDEMSNIDPQELVDKIKDITHNEHQLFYYGQNTADKAFELLKQGHKIPETLTKIEEAKKYIQQEINKPVVYFVNYDMVQTQMLILSKDELLDNTLTPNIRLFNEYYGSGLSSIVFQEIRESRALAYSAYSYFTTPSRKDMAHYNYSFVATQPDKLKTATDAMTDLLNNMPEAENQFELAKDAIMKNIETERIIKDRVFWTYMSAKDRGLDYDNRKDIYEHMQTVSLDEFEEFFNAHVANKQYAYMVIGNKDLIDFNVLKKLGPVKELSLEEIFNY